ncbi:hypothetical protein GCM10009717_11960 [Agromyces allii]|uniref:Uncharacterized protein n=1 Tax=Agromyces allii TaxID=393607 RepID=A0ABP5BKR9_9MICO
MAGSIPAGSVMRPEMLDVPVPTAWAGCAENAMADMTSAITALMTTQARRRVVTKAFTGCLPALRCVPVHDRHGHDLEPVSSAG